MKLNVQQYDRTDCGAACLASIARYYKLKLPIWEIRLHAGTNRIGTSAFGLVQAAEKLGFEAKGVEIEKEHLAEIPLPAIVHIRLSNGGHHFVVVYRVNKHKIRFMDPGEGKMKTLTIEEFVKDWTGIAILLIPSTTFQSGNRKVSYIKRLWSVVSPYKSIFIQSGFGALAFSILGLSTAFYIQKLTDFVLVGHNLNLLNLFGVIMVAILLMQVALGSMQSWFVLRVSQNIDLGLISGYYKHLLRLPQRFFDSIRVGELISRVNDAVKIRTFINQVAVESVVDILIVLIAFMVMFVFNWKLALFAYSILPIYILVFWLSNAFNRRVERLKMECTADLEIQLVESLKAVKTIKQMGAEEHFENQVDSKLVNVLKQVYRSGKMDIVFNSSTHFINRSLTLGILWVGSLFVIGKELTPGELMSFFAITAYFTGPIGRLVAVNKNIHGALIALDRLFELLELDNEKKTDQAVDIKHDDVGDIIFTNVNFSYTIEQELFKDLNLQVKNNSITVLLGDSGSGKSTISALIQGLYSISGGQLKIGSLDVSHINLSSLRRVVGIVPQDIELFAGNVIENIALGDPQPDIRRINEIIEQLKLEETINQLPEGLYTWLGENATQLSGGQRQRLAIARMLYLSPQIYIFDEATSFLDDRSEAVVKDIILQLKKEGKTILMVAHRMSVINIADQVMVFSKGKLIQNGSVAELQADKNGRFYEMLLHHKN